MGTWQTARVDLPQKSTIKMFLCTQIIRRWVLNQLLICVTGQPDLLVPRTISQNHSVLWLLYQESPDTVTNVPPTKNRHPQRRQA